MTENRYVKINLKVFLEDMLIAISSRDTDKMAELDDKLSHFMTNQSDKLNKDIIEYFMKAKIVADNSCLMSYILKLGV